MTEHAMTEPSPFHDGELAVQRRAGVERKAEAGGRHGIRSFMPDQHREFFTQLPFLIVGSADETGAVWASMLVGAPGFIQSPDPQSLSIAARPSPGDPLAGNLKPEARIGLLGIQPETRRRNRMNGHVTSVTESGFTIAVDQSFGNCPQYIQAREPVLTEDALTPRIETEGTHLSTAAKSLIMSSDTFFIGSTSADPAVADSRHGVDVSHRGGKPGFVRVTEDATGTVLTAPDFRGNNFFNTLGNIAANPQSGLLFVDFATGDLLQLTGEADILWEDPALATFTGAQRLLRFRASHGHLLRNALPLRWSEAEMAPQLEKTGSWESAAL